MACPAMRACRQHDQQQQHAFDFSLCIGLLTFAVVRLRGATECAPPCCSNETSMTRCLGRWRAPSKWHRRAAAKPAIHLLTALAYCACSVRLQTWDINEPLPGEVEGPFQVALATNVLHAGRNLKSERPGSCPSSQAIHPFAVCCATNESMLLLILQLDWHAWANCYMSIWRACKA